MQRGGFRLRPATFSCIDPRHPLLVYRSRPKEDELLLSWITRLARGNAVKLQSFATDILGFSSQLLCHDLDRFHDEELLARLVKRVGCLPGQASATGLWAYEGYLWFQMPRRGPVSWVMPMGRSAGDRRRVSSYSTQICCACLYSDPIPYFRRFWRLALAVVCPVHGIYLRDCCPWCHSPIEFHTSDIGRHLLPAEDPLIRCGKCGQDWCHEQWLDQKAPQTLVAFQKELYALLSNGWSSVLPGAENYSPLFFEGLKRLLQLLIQPGRFALVRNFLAQQNSELLLDPPISCPRRFESLRIGDRARFLAMANGLLTDWPEDFLTAARVNRVSSSYINRYGESLPYWFLDPVLMNLFDRDYAPTKMEREAAKDYLLSHGGTGCRDEVNGLLGVSSANYSRARPQRWNPRGPNSTHPDRI